MKTKHLSVSEWVKTLLSFEKEFYSKVSNWASAIGFVWFPSVGVCVDNEDVKQKLPMSIFYAEAGRYTQLQRLLSQLRNTNFQLVRFLLQKFRNFPYNDLLFFLQCILYYDVTFVSVKQEKIFL
jgi:hypothetical protein